jgi:capsular polysaccharide export protein
MYISFSRKLARVLNCSGLLAAKVSYHILPFLPLQNKTVFVWKKHRNKVLNFAHKHKLNAIQIEDAFIGYLKNSQGKMVNIGLYWDESAGIYYSSRQNIITQTINNTNYTDENLKEAEILMQRIAAHQITKHNKTFQPKFTPSPEAAPILLIDQVYGDSSLLENHHGKKEFEKMYNAAVKQANGRKIYIKTHPMGKGYLEEIHKKTEVILIKEDHNIYEILNQMEEIWTVSSQAGFEALLSGKKVRTFGTPFYAGYGMTEDDIHIPNRQQTTIEALFYASYIKACRYFIAGVECTLEEIVNVIIEHKRLVAKDSQIKRLFIFNIPIWKRYSMLAFLFGKNTKRIHISNHTQLQAYSPNSQDAILRWGYSKTDEYLTAYAENNNIPIMTFEDGFLRSVGLGSDLTLPYSLVIDKHGIYYNYHQKSELEVILQDLKLTEYEITRAKKLQEALKITNISKYNITQSHGEPLHTNNNSKHIILITGQVADDMSIIKGGTTIFDYETLVKKVRAENPDAYIIYKHHPDVVAKNRKGYISNALLLQYVDLTVQHAHIIDLIRISDEIHTLTSLAGFEGLIHGKKVTHYALPFYGGYGFTTDKCGISHSRKQTDFNTFLYATLCIYARYTIPNTHIALTPEVIIKVLYNEMQNKQPEKQTYIERRLLQFLRGLKYTLHNKT